MRDELIRSGAELGNDGLLEWRCGSDQLCVTQRFAELVGRAPDELPTTLEGLVELVHADERGAALAWLRGLSAASAGETFERELRLLDAGGTLRWARCRCRVDPPAAGETARHVRGAFFDITGLRRAEEALREKEEQYRQLIESLPHGVGVIRDRRAVFANRAMLDLLGCSSLEDLERRDALEPIAAPERERVLAMAGRLLRREVPGPLHYTTRARNEATDVEFPVEVYLSAITHHGRPALQLFMLDISERELAETERRRLEAQLAQARTLESLGRLAGGIAHDFNNLLTPILAFSDLTLLELDPADPRYDDIAQIRAAAQRAKELTQQLLASARKQLLRVRVIQLNDVINDAQPMLRRLIREDVEIVVDLAQTLGAVRADPAQVQQVLINLAANASDAMPRGGRLVIRTRSAELNEARAADLTEVHPGRYAVLEVQDSGAGMDPETLAHVFEPFYTTKEKTRGTGLGLATVHGIVKQHGGQITVESQPACGTRFSIYLPSVAALRAARAHAGQIDVLLTDVIMPQLNGRALHERLAVERPGIAVVYMSGYADDILGDLVAQGVPLVQKPFGVEELVGAIGRALRKRAAG